MVGFYESGRGCVKILENGRGVIESGRGASTVVGGQNLGKW